MPAVEHAVIAAAGMGVRLGRGQPKCLTELGGRPLIAHLLERLKDVADVRVVVGFAEHEVMDAVIPLRRDVIFVRNAGYRTTTTLTSYWLGGRFIAAPCLYMDADIWFEPASFARFLDAAAVASGALIGVTAAKTIDAVHAHRDAAGAVARFSRTEAAPDEWANVALLPSGMLEPEPTAVYERLNRFLPLPAAEIAAYEVDRPEDLDRARSAYARWQAAGGEDSRTGPSSPGSRGPAG